jgi:hypothetical protein
MAIRWYFEHSRNFVRKCAPVWFNGLRPDGNELYQRAWIDIQRLWTSSLIRHCSWLVQDLRWKRVESAYSAQPCADLQLLLWIPFRQRQCRFLIRNPCRSSRASIPVPQLDGRSESSRMAWNHRVKILGCRNDHSLRNSENPISYPHYG